MAQEEDGDKWTGRHLDGPIRMFAGNNRGKKLSGRMKVRGDVFVTCFPMDSLITSNTLCHCSAETNMASFYPQAT